MSSEDVPLENACLFNNNLKCHPRSAEYFDNIFTFVEKVCAQCPLLDVIKKDVKKKKGIFK